MTLLKYFAIFVAASSIAAAQPQGLSAYLDKDLRKLKGDQLAAFWKTFESLVPRGGEKEEKDRGIDPWFVKTFKSGNAAWILAEVYPGYDVPDVSYARVHLFDKNWNRFAVKSFPTGYRAFIRKASIITSRELGQDLLQFVLTSSGPFIVNQNGEEKPAFEQGHFQRQFYANLNGNLSLVRIEDETKETVVNSYQWKAPMKGGPVPRKTAEQWIKSLSAESSAEKLASLVWLSGSHKSSDEPRKENVNQQSIADSKLIEAVRSDPRTKAAVTRLANSEITWIKTYALLTLEIL